MKTASSGIGFGTPSVSKPCNFPLGRFNSSVQTFNASMPSRPVSAQIPNIIDSALYESVRTALPSERSAHVEDVVAAIDDDDDDDDDDEDEEEEEEEDNRFLCSSSNRLSTTSASRRLGKLDTSTDFFTNENVFEEEEEEEEEEEVVEAGFRGASNGFFGFLVFSVFAFSHASPSSFPCCCCCIFCTSRNASNALEFMYSPPPSLTPLTPPFRGAIVLRNCSPPPPPPPRLRRSSLERKVEGENEGELAIAGALALIYNNQ